MIYKLPTTSSSEFLLEIGVHSRGPVKVAFIGASGEKLLICGSTDGSFTFWDVKYDTNSY